MFKMPPRQMVLDCPGKTKKCSDKINTLHSSVTDLNNALDEYSHNLQSRTSYMSDNIQEIKSDFQNSAAALDRVKSDLSELNSEQVKLDKHVFEMEDRINRIFQKVHHLRANDQKLTSASGSEGGLGFLGSTDQDRNGTDTQNCINFAFNSSSKTKIICDGIVTSAYWREAVRGMSNAHVNIKFRWGLSASDPEQQPVLIVGQAIHLNTLTWHDVRCKLEPRVTEESWRRGMACVGGGCGGAGEPVELWPRAATLAALPARRSRHAPPARAHALAKLVRATQRAADECIVLVCRKRDVYASAVAIARSYPLYHARSGASPLGTNSPVTPTTPATRTVTVEIYLVKEDKQGGESEDEGIGVLDPDLTDNTLSSEELATLQAAADGTRLAARITDTPANIMNVDKFIEEACKVAKELDIQEPTIIRGEELKERGMGGIYGVGKAAACPPALVALSYHAPNATETVAWVGKGIVYDTGGLSIKARTSMVGMKGDCGGAAAVLGAFGAMVRARPTVHLHAVLCLAENSVGPNATRPDDIHQLYSGRTVEINNTDAEGRLVLSDGVVFASRDLKADTIVDVATLTGAQGTATGKYHAAVLSNSAGLERAAVAAGLRSGDLAHPLPFAPEMHFSEFSSAVADMKNSVADRNNAQPSCAGLFVLAHLGFEFAGRWLHVDMAAPAHCGERATGYGVALLTVLFGGNTHSKLLRALSPRSTPA